MHIERQDAERSSGIEHAINVQDENPSEVYFDFEEIHRNRSNMDTDLYDFRGQARRLSKAIPGTCCRDNSVDGLNDYGPFIISCSKDMSPISSGAVATTSVYSSGDGSTICSLIAESSGWDAQTLVTSKSENSMNGEIWPVGHKSKALYEMLGIEVAQIRGRRVLTDTRYYGKPCQRTKN